MLMPVSMASHDKKSHVAPHFDYLDIRDALVPLMPMLVPMASHDQEIHAAYHFSCFYLRKTMSFMMLVV